MANAYFSRVFENTNWESLIRILRTQKSLQSKALAYKILIELSIPSRDFDILVNQLAKPHLCYLQYSFDSVTDIDGIWKCILINSRDDIRKLAIYTAGRTFPLYAAIIEDENNSN